MADQDIIQNMITRLGQSQGQRLPAILDRDSPDFVGIDERSGAELLAQWRGLAYRLNLYSRQADMPSGNWSSFFPKVEFAAGTLDQHTRELLEKAADALARQDHAGWAALLSDNTEHRALLEGLAAQDLESLGKLLERDDGQVPPHLGLLAAFLHLYRQTQLALNTLTARHLDYQFRNVLRFMPKPARPDHAHLLLELKKNTSAVEIGPAHQFSAGKDATGKELIYRPVRTTIIGHARVESLQSVFHDRDGLFFAPIANSVDAVGGTTDTSALKWPPFGGNHLPAARIGFALSAQALRLQEGKRQIVARITLGGLKGSIHTAPRLSAAFETYLTGPKGWLGPFQTVASTSSGTLTLTVEVDASQPAIIDYEHKIHGHAFAAQGPVLQFLLKPDAALKYDDLAALTIQTAKLTVNVDDVRSVTLENDDGSLNPKKAFLPFGVQPVVGSRFMIGSDEILSKKISRLDIHLNWMGAPQDLASWYTGYSKVRQFNDGVSAKLFFQDHSRQQTAVNVTLINRHPGTSTTISTASILTTPHKVSDRLEVRLHALKTAGSLKARQIGHGMSIGHLADYLGNQPHESVVPVRDGYITVSLSEDFLHSDYRKETVANTLAKVASPTNTSIPGPLNEPYTPKAQSISLSYSATTDQVSINTTTEESFTLSDLQFFHVGCFGQRREHGYLRQQYEYLSRKDVPLLPEYPYEGEFLIGTSGVSAGDGVSLLVQVAEDSASPDFPPAEITWSVLCDNYWRPLSDLEVSLETTANLRGNGIAAFTLPSDTSTDHTWMAGGMVWIRAAVMRNSAATCQLLAVHANAIEVQFTDQHNDPAHLAAPLPDGKISKLKTPIGAIKTVMQPYASFGGAAEESSTMLTRRAAERLRHRNRCITPWDYERMLLEAFPQIHKVKCIPHASADSWLAPGHVMLIAIPNMRGRNPADRLQPRADIATLAQMQEFAQRHASGQVNIKVRNPSYLKILLDFKVRFKRGYPFNFYRQKLNESLVQLMTPWASDQMREIEFGGRIYRSSLLDFTEKLDYVDFVTDFRMRAIALDGHPMQDIAEIAADTPDVILVSSPTHIINEYQQA